MGTVLEITICSQTNNNAPQSSSLNSLEPFFTAASRLESLFSTFSQDSVISQLNRHAGQGALTVPVEVTDSLALSKHYERLSKGTFDVTVGPLLTLWKNSGTTQTPPSSAMLQRTRATVGSDKIHIFPNNRVALTRPGMSIDLGGIGKGYALDRIVDILKSQGSKNALLDFGQSSIWALGTPLDAPKWRLLLQQPDGHNVGVISLQDQALSISASFGQQYAIQGKRYSHIIDPRTGIPLQRGLLACVIAPNATQAEALSKALLILGEHKGIALLESLSSVEGLLVEEPGKQWMTRGWRKITDFRPEPSQLPATAIPLSHKPLYKEQPKNETAPSKGK